ncbi:hypothetical protein LMG33818_000880 [Halomonadaceae bacterium LMG 33818]|uniref:Arc family DNA-binding protein n=1 Tax=Cernens ardua TaxID=3402176 RepID=UPI003EDC5C7B
MSDNKQQARPYPIRMTEEMRSYLEERAFSNKRSLHAEIMKRIEDSIDREKMIEGSYQYEDIDEDHFDHDFNENFVLDIDANHLKKIIEKSNKKILQEITEKYGRKPAEGEFD